MRRREFVSLLGGTSMVSLVRPVAARAQQPGMPVIGFLSSVSAAADLLAAFRRGLSEEGYVEGRNVTIEYRDAEGHYERLPRLASDLVSLPVAVIAAVPSSPAAIAAKAATSTIPIVFLLGVDPMELGLVASYNRPGGNVTGISVITTSLTPKRIEMLHELLPRSASIAELVNPANRAVDEEVRLAQEAARALGRNFIVVEAHTDGEVDTAFESLTRQQAGGLVVWAEAYLTTRRDQIVSLAGRHRIPAVYPSLFAEAGGLISYGPDLREAWRQTGIYVGKILKGARAAELPVVQPTRFELVINLKTAKALGLTVPSSLLARADEVIE